MVRTLRFAAFLGLLALPIGAQAQSISDLFDGSLDPFNKNNDLGVHIDTKKLQGHYETNKFRLKARVEAGGWHVAWADDIAEKDALAGLVAAGVSVNSANPGPFLAWVDYLVNRTMVSLQQSGARIPGNLQREVRGIAAQVIREAVRGRSAKEISRNFGGMGVKAGAIQYSGANMLGNQVVTRTWGIKPYIAVRLTRPPQMQGGPPARLPRLPKYRGQQTGMVFQKSPQGREWVAINGRGVVARFVEVQRTPQFITLQSRSNFPDIRLFANHVEQRNRNQPFWRFSERAARIR